MEVDRNMGMFSREYMSRRIIDDDIDHYDEFPIIQIEKVLSKIYASARCDFDKISNHGKLESIESHRGDSDEEFTKELDAFLGQFKIIKEGDEEI